MVDERGWRFLTLGSGGLGRVSDMTIRRDPEGLAERGRPVFLGMATPMRATTVEDAHGSLAAGPAPPARSDGCRLVREPPKKQITAPAGAPDTTTSRTGASAVACARIFESWVSSRAQGSA
ncbi:hypothetical protein AB0J35_29115 [Nonomuraea angiospora]|uniref:hypothetical protein n=1 Tax=Nonomuraea angiospora TaxID=46172 RepID=UPI0034234292